MTRYRRTQEVFWAEECGNTYIDRNKNDRDVSRNVAFFPRILSRTQGVASAIKFGANIGLNLRAIRQLLPKVRRSAVEINKKAAKDLNRLQLDKGFTISLRDLMPQKTYDFVLCKGVLIHINPKQPHKVCGTMYCSSDALYLRGRILQP